MSSIEYITCTFLDDYNVGDEFTEWPLHITLVPWFFVEDLPKLQVDMKQQLQNTEPISFTIGEQLIWGPNTVNLVQNSQPLHALHGRLRDLIKTSGKILINEHFTGALYTPHVTHQETSSAKFGETAIVNAVYLIQKDMDSRLKTVIDKTYLIS